jgi:uncharacterized protein YndB with AHSA1/START domain
MTDVTTQLRDIVVEELLPHGAEAVWEVLTTSELIGRWLMPNDFAPAVGTRFNFRTKPMGDWDGVVHCEVLEVVPRRKLAYSWKGGANSNSKYGSTLDSVVTWTLTPVAGGTRLKLVHAGFRSPENDFAFDAMRSGWGRALQAIGVIAGERGSRPAA